MKIEAGSFKNKFRYSLLYGRVTIAAEAAIKNNSGRQADKVVEIWSMPSGYKSRV
jgi:hypothetical protein